MHYSVHATNETEQITCWKHGCPIGDINYEPKFCGQCGTNVLGMRSELNEEDEGPHGGLELWGAWNKKTEVSPECYTDMKALESGLGSMEDFMQAIFGDHCWIQVTKVGIEVQEYEHD